MTFRWIIAVAAVLSMNAPVARAQVAPSMLAVLEFSAADPSIDADGLLVLTDALRSAVVSEVGDRFKVLTRETMVELVPPERLQCFVDKCAAEIGRMLQAPYVMAGTLRPMSGGLVLTLEGYESQTGRLLGAEQFFGVNIAALFASIRENGRRLAREWFVQRLASTAPTSERSSSEPPATGAPTVAAPGLPPAAVAGPVAQPGQRNGAWAVSAWTTGIAAAIAMGGSIWQGSESTRLHGIYMGLPAGAGQSAFDAAYQNHLGAAQLATTLAGVGGVLAIGSALTGWMALTPMPDALHAPAVLTGLRLHLSPSGARVQGVW